MSEPSGERHAIAPCVIRMKYDTPHENTNLGVTFKALWAVSGQLTII